MLFSSTERQFSFPITDTANHDRNNHIERSPGLELSMFSFHSISPMVSNHQLHSQDSTKIFYRIRKFRNTPLLTEEYLQFNRLSSMTRHIPISAYLGVLQPIPAYIGLAFCMSTALVFFTASIWNDNRGLIITYSAFLSVSTLSSRPIT
jgi:hypothetical protein